MYKRAPYLLSLLVALVLTLSSTPRAAWADHYHVIYEQDVNYYNAYVQSYTGSIYGDSNGFITKELWRNTIQPVPGPSLNEWTEMGDTSGLLDGSYYQGTFYACNYSDGGGGTTDYVEGPLTSGTQGTPHGFNIGQDSSPYYVDFYLDGTEVGPLCEASRTYAVSMQEGLESSDDSVSGYFYPFDSPTLTYNMQYYAGGSAYTQWPLYASSDSYNDSNGLVTEEYSPVDTNIGEVPASTFTYN